MEPAVFIVLGMPVDAGSMVEVRVFAWHVREGVMADNVLVVPDVGCTEVEADLGSEGIDAPVA